MLRHLKRMWRERRAVAALEMALVTTFFLLPVTSGIIGSGQALLAQYRVDRALHAGLMSAWGTPTTATTTSVQNAAQSGSGATSMTVAATASFAWYCISPTGTRGSGTAMSAAPPTGTCTAPQIAAEWVTVSTSSNFTPIFPVPWGGSAWTLSATGTVRIK